MKYIPEGYLCAWCGAWLDDKDADNANAFNSAYFSDKKENYKIIRITNHDCKVKDKSIINTTVYKKENEK